MIETLTTGVSLFYFLGPRRHNFLNADFLRRDDVLDSIWVILHCQAVAWPFSLWVFLEACQGETAVFAWLQLHNSDVKERLWNQFGDAEYAFT